MAKQHILEKPSVERWEEFLAAVKRSRRLHKGWVSPPATVEAFHTYMKRYEMDTHLGYWVLTESGELAGVININEIVRGTFRSGYLGYYGFQPHNGQGYMRAGLLAVLKEAFAKEKLHRLEANIQPTNAASRRLVESIGFRLEGYSPHYLKCAGRWRDHERWAITVENWRTLRRNSR